jgi:hypothetical protein
MFTLKNLRIMALAKHLDIHFLDAEHLLSEKAYKVTMLNDFEDSTVMIRINDVCLFIRKGAK